MLYSNKQTKLPLSRESTSDYEEKQSPEEMLRSLQGIFCKGRYSSWVLRKELEKKHDQKKKNAKYQGEKMDKKFAVFIDADYISANEYLPAVGEIKSRYGEVVIKRVY